MNKGIDEITKINGYISFLYEINKNFIFIYEHHNFNMFITIWMILFFTHLTFYQKMRFKFILIFIGTAIVTIGFIVTS